jgi:hypothetical protein
MQIQAERAQSETEFLREERQESYAALITAWDDAFMTTANMGPKIEDYHAAHEKMRSVRAASSAIAVTGSEEARSAAREVLTDTQVWINAIWQLKTSRAMSTPDPQAVVQEASTEMAYSISRFIDIARRDLGASPQ